MMKIYSDRLARSSIHSIRTPEGVVFSFPLAGIFSRFLALIMDMVLVAFLASTLGAALMALRVLSYDLAAASFLIQGFVLSIGYPMFMEWAYHGQTVGKKIMSIRVMDEAGLKLRFSQVFARNVLRFADMLPAFYMLGGIATLLNARSQRLGDLVAGTVVVTLPDIREPDLRGTLAGRYNTFRDYPHIAARLRQNVLPDEAGLILAAIERREELDPDARVGLFNKFRTHLESKVRFPPVATDGLSDEQFVRNAVDILYH